MTQSSKIPYTKPHYTYAQQLNALVNKGMVIDMAESQALHYLSHCNYYRLSGYWYDYKVNNTEAFKTNTHFSEIVQLYQFDKELRILLLDAIEQIEVSVRTKMAYHLGEAYGAHALLNEAVFRHQGAYQKTLVKLKKESLDSNKVFIQHFIAKYQEPLPPIWAVVELMSMGQLSHCYKNLKTRQDAKVIADNFDLDSKTLQSFLHHLTTLRNHCAHHSRVWNRRFTITLQRPKKPAALVSAWQGDAIASKKLYNTLIMMVWMLNIIEPEHNWTHRLLALLNEYKGIDSNNMGFIDTWQSQEIWSVSRD